MLEPGAYNCVPRNCQFESLPTGTSFQCYHNISQYFDSVIDDLNETNIFYEGNCTLQN